VTTISQERTRLAAIGQGLRTREQAGLRRSYTDARSVVEPATRVFVHITVSNPESYSSDDAHWRAIEAIGIARFPNTGISYNRGLMRSGTAYEGQPIGRRGAHTYNDFNRSTCITTGCPGRGGPLTATPAWNLNYNSRAYVICQNVQHSVTDAQLDALARAIAADMLAGFVRRDAEIHGHRCVSPKSCPGDRMWALMATLRARVDHYLRNGLTEDDMTREQAQQLESVFRAIARLEGSGDGSGSIEWHVWNNTGPGGRGPAVRASIAAIEAGVATLLAQADVDEAAIAANLAPLLIPHLPDVVADLDDETIARIAAMVADEQARRLQS
jgi:N-acetylmuramoyl-L-alanine amidase